jgi:hypothetical protein
VTRSNVANPIALRKGKAVNFLSAPVFIRVHLCPSVVKIHFNFTLTPPAAAIFSKLPS